MTCMVSLLFGGLATFGGVVTFGGSLFSGFFSGHKVLTLLSGGRYFRRVVTIGTLRYMSNLSMGLCGKLTKSII